MKVRNQEHAREIIKLELGIMLPDLPLSKEADKASDCTIDWTEVSVHDLIQIIRRTVVKNLGQRILNELNARYWRA